jgi:nicotinamidase-related amidase
MKTALLVIGVQQGLRKGEHRAFESAQVIGRINRVSFRTRTVSGEALQIEA